MILLVVESPHKVGPISGFLGKGYKVMASIGHFMDLPKSKLGVDVADGFRPEYVPVKSKTDLIKQLKTEAKKADKVYLATDPDREGEAISWHLANVLDIDKSSLCRITFNEVTKTAVQNAIQHPRSINLDLVDAQQARRVLDRLVGYEISPVLWKKVKVGLSAGRVQSPAVRLIVDREREIQAFTPTEYWNLDVHLSDGTTSFTAAFYGKDGKKTELPDSEAVENIKKELDGARFTVISYREGTKKRSSPTPFSTSALLQDASRKLGFTTRKTMKIAQDLYEGVTLNGGGAGLITYIRTDSLRISAEALDEVREHILHEFGPKYLPDKPRVYKTKGNIQDAHEAIRPTSMSRRPKDIRASLTDDQYKLYKLIYERFTACQMTDALYATKNADIGAGGYLFKAGAQERIFDGYMAAYVEGHDTKPDEDKTRVPAMHEGQSLEFSGFDSAQHFTEPPARFNEATLVDELKNCGIGRPSTYAAIVSTILDRQYVEREKKSLRPTILGFCVVDFMMDAFPDIVNVGFTADMESELDKVECGTRNWTDLISGFYGDFHQSVEKAEEAKHVRVPVEETDIPCEKCGKLLVVRSSRFGKFLACPGYPECKFTRPMPEDEITQPCPKCGGKLTRRTSKAGKKFYGCSNYPQCDFASNGIPTGDICPECGGFIISGFRGRKYCMNLECPTREKDRERIAARAAAMEKKAEKAAEKPEKAAKTTKSAKAAKSTDEKTKKAAKTAKSAKAAKSTDEKPKKAAKTTKAAKSTDEKPKKAAKTTKSAKAAKSTDEKPKKAAKTTKAAKAADEKPEKAAEL